MKRDLASGSLLIAGAAGGVVVMALHPTAHGLMNAESGPHLTQLNVTVHGLAPSDLATAALGVYVWGCVAAEGSKMPDAFLLYTGLWNQGFAKVNVVATSIGILLCRERGERLR